jgi:hypothetical protein
LVRQVLVAVVVATGRMEAGVPQTEAEAGDVMSDDWQPTRWWLVNDPDDKLWCETSDEQEARERMRPGDTLSRLWRREEFEWREVTL